MSLIERLEVLADRQRHARGDILMYGDPDPEIVEAAALIRELVEALNDARNELRRQHNGVAFDREFRSREVVGHIDAALAKVSQP